LFADMPHSPYAGEAFDGFVSMSQLTASPVAVPEDDLIDVAHEYVLGKGNLPSWYDPGDQSSTKPMPNFNGSLPDTGRNMSVSSDLTMTPFHNSSASSSPSPRESFFSVQQEQHHKRRAQNRAAWVFLYHTSSSVR
jgi:hypothetical protein